MGTNIAAVIDRRPGPGTCWRSIAGASETLRLRVLARAFEDYGSLAGRFPSLSTRPPKRVRVSLNAAFGVAFPLTLRAIRRRSTAEPCGSPRGR